MRYRFQSISNPVPFVSAHSHASDVHPSPFEAILTGAMPLPARFLNIDLGELPDEPEALYPIAHLANIACGGHAGDRNSMIQALEHCRRYGTAAAAHPSFPDPENFGRKPMSMPLHQLRASIAEQCDRLVDLAGRVGWPLSAIKPHGALYHSAHRDDSIAKAVVAGAIESLGYEVYLLGPEGGGLQRAAHEAGIGFLREGFADRAMLPDGSLVARTEPGALISNPSLAAKQARDLIRSGRFETLCVHGDSPHALEIARAVRNVFDQLAMETKL
jgi:5-oxoprolinase (ATP-hydrolysing) subunit A